MVSEILHRRGGGMPLGTHAVTMNDSYHKEHEYIWFRNGDLKRF